MARGLNLKPSRVYQIVTQILESRGMPQPPPWYKTIESIPPAAILTRTQPVQHRELRKSKKRKPSRMFHPQPIEYEEDKLRRDFFRDHPWELARPRIVLENDGRDGQKVDWSRGIQQPGRQLSGESVVQRQLWLMNEQGMPNSQAYDMARKEFYHLRHQEDVERRVAREEAEWVGADFAKGALEVSMELEDKSYESWKSWAEKEVEVLNRQRDGAYTAAVTEHGDDTFERLGGDDIVVESTDTPDQPS
ncbi:mitochondrial ribosomal protein S25 [Calycina marina]|uniref:37S ribosomal protein S25, mitochondrial n=1 Tax=Calycina marina TaxID=1763456 RepID=A0A9P7YXC1_9HELO|nr:mitochondrial ribosomal protein S25 [Calycina marina]